MRKTIIALVVAGLLTLATITPAFAIVHAVTPIVEAGAVAASGGEAGGFGARFTVIANSAAGPPMPAQAGTALPDPVP